MRIKVKSAFYNASGLHGRGEVVEIPEKDFDATTMEPVEGDPEQEQEEQPKKAPAKPGRKKKA